MKTFRLWICWPAIAAMAFAAGLFPGTLYGAESELVIGVGRDFLDGPDSRTYLHGSTHTWEALTYLDEHLKATPWLAREWQSRNNCQTWVFSLQDKVCFHDGTPMTAKLAKASILRIAQSPKYDPAGVYRDLDRLEATGPLELSFYLKKSRPDFPNAVSYYSSPILHPDSFGIDGRLKGITGTGPYCLEKARPGYSITLKAFADHWGPDPGFERVVFRTLTDAQTRAMALMSGEVDAVADVGGILPQQVEILKNRPGLFLGRVEVATTHYLIFNCRTALFNKADARHWLAGLLERPRMVEALVHKAGKVAKDPYSPLARDWAFSHLTIRQVPAPLPGKTPLRILVHTGTLERWPYLDIAQFIQARLGAKGFKAEIALRESGAYYQEIQEGNFHMALQPNTLMTGDPDFFYAYYLASDGPRYYGCGSPKIDELILDGRHATDLSQRREIYRQLSLLFAWDLPLLPLYHDISYYAHGKKVGNFSMDQNFRPRLVDAGPALYGP